MWFQIMAAVLGEILLHTFAYTFLKSIFLGHNAFEKSQTSKGHGEAHIKLKIGPNNCSEHFNEHFTTLIVYRSLCIWTWRWFLLTTCRLVLTIAVHTSHGLWFFSMFVIQVSPYEVKDSTIRHKAWSEIIIVEQNHILMAISKL